MRTLTMLLAVLVACDVSTSDADDTGADTGAAGASDAAGGQEGEELIGDTGGPDTDDTSSAGGAALTASTSTVAFGPWLVGCSTEASLTVTNNTDATLSLDTITADDSDELSLSALSLPLALGPGDDATLAIRYAPLREGTLSATLRLHTDKGLGAQIGLDGQGMLFSAGDDAFIASDDGQRFSLTQAAVAQTLSVTVDGTPLPDTEYTFSEADQTLILASPAPIGASVTVRYAVQPPSCD